PHPPRPALPLRRALGPRRPLASRAADAVGGSVLAPDRIGHPGGETAARAGNRALDGRLLRSRCPGPTERLTHERDADPALVTGDARAEIDDQRGERDEEHHGGLGGLSHG